VCHAALRPDLHPALCLWRARATHDALLLCLIILCDHALCSLLCLLFCARASRETTKRNEQLFVQRVEQEAQELFCVLLVAALEGRRVS
jgi:hypothetical protein